MTVQHHVQIMDAAGGDENAAVGLLTDLISRELDTQLDTIQEIKLCKDVRFWKLALEFEVYGTWAGKSVPGFGGGNVNGRRTREFMEEFLENDDFGAGVAKAQEQALLESAKTGPTDIRAHALQLLGIHHCADSSARELLSSALSDPMVSVRLSAASALGRIGDDSAIRELAGHLSDADYRTRHRSRLELSAVGEPALPALKAILEEAGGQARWEAAKAISGIRSDESAHILARCLLDENHGIRAVAADGLIAMEERAVVPVLEMLKSHGESAVVRAGAHHVFTKLSHHGFFPRALGHVIHALDNGLLPEIMPLEASTALETIGRQGAESTT